MRFAIATWEAARNADVSLLERVIFWKEDGSEVRILSPSRARERASFPRSRPMCIGP